LAILFCFLVSAFEFSSERGGHLEGFALDWSLNEAAAEALGADAGAADGAAGLDLHALQVGTEGATAAAGNLPADAAEVLGLAAVGILIAFRRLLAADGTL
jgi:hypothetical protein